MSLRALQTSLDRKERRRSSWGDLSTVEWVRFGLEALGVLAVVAAVIGLWIDFSARDEDRVNRAWQLVADRTGVRTALEFLNSRGEDLSGLPLSYGYLGGAQLSGAELEGADLGEARLGDADLREANLADAHLSRANLETADLRKADLRDANLDSATLRGADLRGATLTGANLMGADLREANLAGAELAGASFCDSRMPDASVCNRDCNSEPIRARPDTTCPWFQGR